MYEGLNQGLGQTRPTSQQDMDVQHAKKQAAMLAGQLMPKRDASPIEMAARELGQRVEHLHEMLSKLQQRLESVSAPQESVLGSANGIGHPEPPKAPLEVQLQNLASGVQSATSKISMMLDYLHI